MKTIIIKVVASGENPKFPNLGIEIEDEGWRSAQWFPESGRKFKVGKPLINELKAHLEEIKDEKIKDTKYLKNYELVKGAISDLDIVLYQKGR